MRGSNPPGKKKKKVKIKELRKWQKTVIKVIDILCFNATLKKSVQKSMMNNLYQKFK